MKPKYFIYISDTKVDMLLPQVPHDIKKKVATEFKLGLKVFEVSRKSETESEENRVARLQSVVQYLRSEVPLGSVDQPSEYIEGELPMKWGPYVLLVPDFQTPSPETSRKPSQTDFVLFGGTTDKTFCGLVGSARHLVGSRISKDAAEDYMGSALPTAMHYLQELAGRNFDSISNGALDVLGSVIERLHGPAQHLEFVAKRLLEGSATHGSKSRCLLASPLYVALAE